MDKVGTMRKIAVVNLRFYPAVGGAETLILEICKRLTDKFKFQIVTSDVKIELPYSKLSADDMLSRYENLDITRLNSIHLLPFEGYGCIVKKLPFALKDAELIHTYGYGYYHSDKAIRVGVKRSIPVIFTPLLHTTSFVRHRMLRRIYDSTIGRKSMLLCDKIISLSNEEKNYIAKRFNIPIDKISYIPCGIDLDKFKDLGRERDSNTLLFVGRLSKVKGLEVLVEALHTVKREIPDVRLKLAGEDWGMKKEIINMAIKFGVRDDIEFLGKVTEEELIELCNSVKLFVTSTKYESFGISALEAIACGTPVVASRVGGLPEAVGDCGLLCDRNAADFAENILKMLKDESLYERCKKNTIAWREKFSWDVIAEKISNIYSEMLRA